MERVYEATFKVVASVTAESEEQAKDIAVDEVTKGIFNEAEFESAEFITIEEYTGTVPYIFKGIIDEPQAKDDKAMSLID